MARDDQALDPRTVFLDLRSDGRAVPLAVTPDLWRDLAEGRQPLEGRLLGLLEMTAASDHWEAHPAGDELLFLLSGRAEVLLELSEGERRIALPAGHLCLVPAGVWHRVLVREPGRLLFITPGEGTVHRPV